MRTSKTTRGAHEGKFLSLDTEWEADYWARRFGVSNEALADAVAAVGHAVANVGAYLNEETVAHGEGAEAAPMATKPAE
jgi:hypothetical protein